MLISIAELLGRSWRFGTSHWRTLLPYTIWMFLPNIVLALCAYLSLLVAGYNESLNVVIFILVIILVILNAVLGVWVSLSLTYCVGHGVTSGIVPDWKESFINTSQLIVPTIVVTVLVTIIFTLGTIAFIIPGIIFTGWYLFTVYEVLFDNRRGWAALSASKSLVVGRWWSTVVRFVCPVAVFVVLSFAIEFVVLLVIPAPGNLFYERMIRNLVQGIVTSLVAPLAVTSTVLLYINLKQNPLPPSNP